MVSDKEIISAYKLLAAGEGIFVEPASAASVAGLLKLSKQGFFSDSRKKLIIVCVLTGHGLKDPDRAIATIKRPKVLSVSVKKVAKEIGF